MTNNIKRPYTKNIKNRKQKTKDKDKATITQKSVLISCAPKAYVDPAQYVKQVVLFIYIHTR